MPFLPGNLDLVHRPIGGLHELVRRRRDIGQRGDADRRGQAHVELVGGQEAVRRNPVADALGDHDRAVATGLGQDHRELVAAKARHDVGFAGARADDRGGLHQRTAARQVPVGIVHGLEAVQIDEQQRQRRCRCGPRAWSRDEATGS